MSQNLRMATFKKRYGLTQKNVNRLEREGFIEICQGGFRGDSMHHPKIVTIQKEIPSEKVKEMQVRSEREVKQLSLEQRLKELESDFMWLSRMMPQLVDLLCKRARKEQFDKK